MMFVRIIICSTFLICCSNAPKKISNQNAITQQEDDRPITNILGYDLNQPSETFVLGSELIEISGLAFDKESKTFYTHNDELGHYYELNNKDFLISNDIKFSKKGDYESIEKVGDEMVICKSNGTLYFYNIFTKKTRVQKNELQPKNDVEGLCFDEDRNSLLLACKALPLNHITGRLNIKCFYSFDLKTNQLDTVPFITINVEDLENYVSAHYKDTSKSKLKMLMRRTHDFAPSGITMHPESKDYFITSARGSLLVVLDQNRGLKHVDFLNNRTIPQPEGITFDDQNNLYISTEGQGFSGKVFKFLSLNN